MNNFMITNFDINEIVNNCKILIVGEEEVGKTMLCKQIIKTMFKNCP